MAVGAARVSSPGGQRLYSRQRGDRHRGSAGVGVRGRPRIDRTREHHKLRRRPGRIEVHTHRRRKEVVWRNSPPQKMQPVPHLSTLRRVISGGQTGVDRAALDWAIGLGLPHGGWCPKGRKAEDGVIPLRYHLEETTSARYEPRTRRNVMDADATLILNLGAIDGGTLLTENICRRGGKPHLLIQLDVGRTNDEVARARAWLQANNVATLNVAGPRVTKRPGAYQAARQFLSLLAGVDSYPIPEERIWYGSGPPPPDLPSTYTPPQPYRVRRRR